MGASLLDAIRIDTQIGQLGVILRLYDTDKASIADFIRAEVECSQLWQLVRLCDHFSASLGDHVTRQVELDYVSQPARAKDEIDTLITQIISWQLQSNNFLRELRPCDRVQISIVEHAVLNQKRFNIRLQAKTGKFVKQAVFEPLFEQKIQIYDQFGQTPVMCQDFLKKHLLELLEKVQWVVSHPDFFGSPK